MMERTFSIIDFGACSTTDELQTRYIQAAIDECFLQGGGEVQIPEGTFLTGGIRLRSNVCLHLMENAHLKGIRDPEAYGVLEDDVIEPIPNNDRTVKLYHTPTADENFQTYEWFNRAGSRWNHGLIRAAYAKNVSVIGECGSALDGSDCYDALGEEFYRGPHLMNFFYCENITLRGYTCVDSANWAHAFFYSKNLIIEKVKIYAGHDGVHATRCDNITIRQCAFYTGDDCVAGFDNQNVIVQDCLMNTACSAMRLGATNALIEKCRFWGPGEYVFRGSLSLEEKRGGGKPQKIPSHRYNMLSVFTYYADFRTAIREQPGNIIIRHCNIENVDRLLHYNYSGNEIWQKNRPLQSVMFEDVYAMGISMPLTAYGDEKVPLYLTMRNVDIQFAPEDENMDFIHTCYYSMINLENVRIQGLSNGALVRSWGGHGRLIYKNLMCDIPKENYFLTSDKPFVCQAI